MKAIEGSRVFFRGGDVIHRRCAKCRKIKPLEDFFDNAAMKGGKAAYCKSCHALYKINWNKEHPGHNRKHWQKYYEVNRENRLKKWRIDRLEKHQEWLAREKFSYALLLGKIKGQPLLCNACWDIDKVGQQYEAHHPNYNEPLKVIWLCKSCHRRVHRNGLGDRFRK